MPAITGDVLPWSLLAVGSVASLAANVAVAQPTAAGRLIAAWPSFALISSYELLMCHVRRTAMGRSVGPAPRPTTIAGDATRVLSANAQDGRTADVPPIFSVRLGSGRWLTGPMTAHCRAARSRADSADTSAGAGWSSAAARLRSSPSLLVRGKAQRPDDGRPAHRPVTFALDIGSAGFPRTNFLE